MKDDSTRSTDALPKWAQREISRLRANLAIAERHLAETLGCAESNIHIVSGVNKCQPLPRDSRIVYTTPEGKKFEVYLERGFSSSGSKERLRVYGDPTGCLAVFPEASNVVSLATVD